jgi:hypothetical protein
LEERKFVVVEVGRKLELEEKVKQGKAGRDKYAG